MRIPMFAVMVLGCAAAVLAQSTPQPERKKPESLQQRASYAIGFNLGSALRTQRASVGPDQVVQGLLDALTGPNAAWSQQKMWDESYAIGFNQGKALKMQWAPLDPIQAAYGLLDALTGSNAALSQQEMWDAMQAFQRQQPVNHQQQATAASPGLRAVGNEIHWTEYKEIDSDDCVSIPFIGTTCHTVTYKFEFHGRVTRVDRERREYLVLLTSRRIVPQESISLMYWTYKNRAHSWADQQEYRTIEVKYVN